MHYGRYGWSHLFLSWGLGVVFVWIGLNILKNPNDWIGFVPQNVPFDIAREAALKIGGAFDIALGVALILRWWQRTAALAATIHIGAVLIQNGIDAVLIRDVGLLAAALALFTWPTHYRKKHGLGRWFRRKKPVDDYEA